MAGLISWAERSLRFAWQWHFHIPELVYWLLFLIVAPGLGVLSFLLGNLEIAGGGALATVLGVQGIARWKFHRRRARGALVVPLFESSDLQQAKQVQDLVMTALLDHLSDEEAEQVHRVPTVAGPAGRPFVRCLWRRLRAHLVLHGEVRERSDGQLAVYARVLAPAEPEVMHMDPHTRDITPIKTTWRHLFQRLTPENPVSEIEYPLEFAGELEAVIRGTAGQVALALEDYPRAERRLTEALAVRPHSAAHSLDRLRVDLALTIAAQGRDKEAIKQLRKRARQADASPELLRTLCRLFAQTEHDPQLSLSTPQRLGEAISLLRRAAEDRADSQRDMTLYNLANLLAAGTPQQKAEAKQLIDDLLRSRSHYRNAWYVKRERGAIAWNELIEAWEAGDQQSVRERGKEAAQWYGRAIRARPRVRFFWRDGPRVWPYRRFPPAPILHANARDGHEQAGHLLRTIWHEWRFHRKRKRLLQQGEKDFRSGHFESACAAFDWATVGRADRPEIGAHVYRAVLLKQLDEAEGAEAEWRETLSKDPYALLVRAAVARDPEGYPLPKGLPGKEPTDPEAVDRLIAQRGGLGS